MGIRSWKKPMAMASVLVFTMIWLSGCSWYKRGYRYDPKKIPNAAIGIYFMHGELKFVDQEGVVIPPTKFKASIDRKVDTLGKDWRIEKVTSMDVYRVTGSHEVWIQMENDLICLKFDDNWVPIGPCN